MQHNKALFTLYPFIWVSLYHV